MSDFTSSSPITVGYWSIRGLGAPLRMMVMYVDCPLNAVNYDCRPKEGGGYDGSDWFSAKSELKTKNPFINLPYIQDGDILVSQSNACFSYLGRRLGLWGNNPTEEMECEQLLCEAMDLRNKMSHYVYNSTGGREGAEALLKDVTGKNGLLQKFEMWLREITCKKHNGSGHFLIADRATAPDFHLWELLDQYKALAAYYNFPDPLKDYPHLSTFLSGFSARPENTRYLSSKLNALPFNQKMAHFGATPSGAVWTPGMTYTFASDGGSY